MKEAHFYKNLTRSKNRQQKKHRFRDFWAFFLNKPKKLFDVRSFHQSEGLFLSECAALVQQGPTVNIFHVFNRNREEKQGGK